VFNQRIAARLKPLKKHTTKLREDVEFIRGWLREPGEVGSIKPTGPRAAKQMASVADPSNPLPVLELGPGTGPVTSAILERGVAPEKLVSVEYSPEFCKYLSNHFPNVNFVQGDAFDLDRTLEGAGFGEARFQATISAIPLLLVNRRKGAELIDTCLARMPEGAQFCQISYSPKPPIGAIPGRFRVRLLDTVFRNVPPGRLWVYTSDRRS